MAKKLDKSAQEQIARLHAQEKAEKQAAKDAKKNKKTDKGPGRMSQIKQVFDMTRKAEPRLPWVMLGIVLVLAAVGVGIGWPLGNPITFGIIGLVVGVLLAILYMNRRAEKAAFSQIAGRPGAAGAALSTLGRGWTVKEEPVAVSPRHQDLVFLAVGRAGVVLVAEGPTGRVRSLAEGVRRDVSRAVKNVPVTILNVGQYEDQVPLEKAKGTIKALPKAISREEVTAVDRRLSTLRMSQPPIPKGIDPQRMRPNRKALRGR